MPAVTLLAVCALVVIYGAVGEITAVIAVAGERAGAGQYTFAEPGTPVVLTGVAAAGPAGAFARGLAEAATQGGTVDWRGRPKPSSASGGKPSSSQGEADDSVSPPSPPSPDPPTAER